MNETQITESRRNFLSQTGALLGIGTFSFIMPGLFSSCQQNEGPTNITGSKKDVDISQFPSLQNDFGAVKTSFTGINSDMPIIIIRKSLGTFLVLTSKCSHQGCEVNLPDSGSKTIMCPCHGSVYSEVDGSVINGPATFGLQQFQSSFNSTTNILTITF
jgi:cytochrome b6-f complex iron-sulfur subunit